MNSTKAYAAEITVTKTEAVLYTAQNAGIYTVTDTSSTPIVNLAANLPIKVIGVTSNGWYQIDYNGTYYMQANGLKSPTIVDGVVFTYSDEEIRNMTKGTFAFYTTRELSQFKKSEIMDMDDNTYIRYLDSYIRGNGVIDNCIIKDSGLKLCEYVSGKVAANSSYSAKTNKEILIDYRIDYLKASIEGPHRTSKAILYALTKAIRYEKNNFVMQFRNASISDNKEKMISIMDENIDTIRKEQGIKYNYSLEYKDDYWYITIEKNNQK